jgi:cytochrome c biogenesis protein CcmG/thiol:disulfide interchange protein DsbE
VYIPSTRTLAAILFAAALLLGSCSKSDRVRHAAAKAESNRKAAPPFALKDAEGKTVSLEDYKGKVVLLNFWATWCGPCKIEIPWFMDFEQKYKDRGFAVVGVSMDEEGWKVVKPYLAEEKINYRVLLGNDSVGTLYGGVDSLPTTFVIDRDGRIAATHIGLVSKSDYQDEILELLEVKQTRAGAGVESRAGVGTN